MESHPAYPFTFLLAEIELDQISELKYEEMGLLSLK